MRRLVHLSLSAFLIAVLSLLTQQSRAADLLFNVTMDTSALIGSSSGPFSLAFTFSNGLFFPDENNTATLTNFTFGGGAPSGSPGAFGGASGNLGTSVTLPDSTFFPPHGLSGFSQMFTPGTTLSFDVDITTDEDFFGLLSDKFRFYILSPSGSGKFLAIDLDGTNTIQTFSDTIGSGPFLNAPIINMGPGGGMAVPEPGVLATLGALTLSVPLGFRRMRRTSGLHCCQYRQ